MARELASHLRLKPQGPISEAPVIQGGEGTGFASAIETYDEARALERKLKVARELASHLRLKPGRGRRHARRFPVWRGNWLRICD